MGWGGVSRRLEVVFLEFLIVEFLFRFGSDGWMGGLRC